MYGPNDRTCIHEALSSKISCIGGLSMSFSILLRRVLSLPLQVELLHNCCATHISKASGQASASLFFFNAGTRFVCACIQQFV